jgi:hypothetical protein
MSDPWTDAMSDHIVIGDRVLLDASFRDAQARLEMLVHDGMLPWASEMAYGEGITSLVTAAAGGCDIPERHMPHARRPGRPVALVRA